MIAFARACSMVDAITWARNATGGTTARLGNPDAAAERQAERDRTARAEDAKDEASRIDYAQRLWTASTPIAGTVAERYLVETRRIPAPAPRWPNAVRFHAPSRSLIVAATTADGTVQAVQRVRLTPDGQKADNPAKITNDVLAGAVVRLPGSPSGPLVLAEGPETGLSAWVAARHETWVALGSIAKVEPPVGCLVVIARDDDLAWSPADRKLRELVKAWTAAGIEVVVASPWPERRGDKSDFNDVLQSGGVAAVRERIKAALTPTIKTISRKPVAIARSIMRDTMTRFFDTTATCHPLFGMPSPLPALAAPAFDPDRPSWEVKHDEPTKPPPFPVHVIRVDVGVGKSEAARQGIAKLLTGMRSRDDGRTAVIAVPTHKLSNEASREFNKLPEAQAAGLVADTWRGRTTNDPDAPGKKMCLDLDSVELARAAGQSVEKACCKDKKRVFGFRPAGLDAPTVECPFFAVCGYQAQIKRRADVWFVAHEMLFKKSR